jgi:Fuc2NAc and GlcNAc transferase
MIALGVTGGLFLAGGETSLGILVLSGASAAAGFLIFNFKPARIFMGDVGSGFLGVTFGLLTVHHASANSDLFWAWLILLGAFIVDATLTLIRRICHGERFYQAHRSHAYQYASRRFQSHARVSIVFGVINLLWLLPIALLVATGRLEGIAGVAVAYLPLAILAWGWVLLDRGREGGALGGARATVASPAELHTRGAAVGGGRRTVPRMGAVR